MPYIAYDLDALDVAPHVARASGISDDAAVAGNARLWAWCWKAKTDLVTAAHLAGFYGSTKVGEAMVAFGFLEAAGESFRVKGAGKYLRISEARSKGGKAASANLRQGPSVPAPPPADSRLEPRLTPGSSPALSSSIEHRASNIEQDDEGPQPLPPKLSGAGFFAWTQAQRREHGLISEAPPNHAALSAWYSLAMGEVSGDDERLRATYGRFTDDEHWKTAKPPWPFAAFIRTWRNHVPSKRAS